MGVEDLWAPLLEIRQYRQTHCSYHIYRQPISWEKYKVVSDNSEGFSIHSFLNKQVKSFRFIVSRPANNRIFLNERKFSLKRNVFLRAFELRTFQLDASCKQWRKWWSCHRCAGSRIENKFDLYCTLALTE